ncbi:MAG: hypothetical protein H6934_03565 [Burkholderiaceae bacterium]|nr:hypothetical protein [Burkholderiaceae bacterium]
MAQGLYPIVETVLVVLAVGACALIVGRRAWRHWRNASGPNGRACVGCDGGAGCAGCEATPARSPPDDRGPSSPGGHRTIRLHPVSDDRKPR